MPAPKANNKPSLDYTSSLLKDVEHAPEQQRHREAIKWSDAGDISVLLKNSPYKTNAPKGTIKQGTSIKGVLRSNPVTLFEGIYDETKGFVFTIPDYIPVGLHTFDIYGVTPNGDPIDLREVVYVAEETDDFDGDGTPNEQEACVLVGSLGIDQDNDGADDACDSELRDISINDSVPELPREVQSRLIPTKIPVHLVVHKVSLCPISHPNTMLTRTIRHNQRPQLLGRQVRRIALQTRITPLRHSQTQAYRHISAMF